MLSFTTNVYFIKGDVMCELNKTKKPHKIKILTKEHSEKFSPVNNEKKNTLNRKRIYVNPTWVYKPVICINTGERFNSLIEAANKFYKNKYSSVEISNVCRGLKSHYKKHLWMFEKDFLSLSKNERVMLKKKCIELNKTYKKYKYKLLFQGTVYDCVADLGEKLFKENLLSYGNNTREDFSKLLSTMIGFAKKKHCPFILLENQYIFWANYVSIYKNSSSSSKISEHPVNKSIEKIYDYYIKRLDNVIGDITISELLQSSKAKFYKLDNLYFKSKGNIKNIFNPEIIDTKTVIYLKDNSNFKFLFNIETFNFNNTPREFYMKNDYIFIKKQNYINRFIKVLTKEELLKELNLIV